MTVSEKQALYAEYRQHALITLTNILTEMTKDLIKGERITLQIASKSQAKANSVKKKSLKRMRLDRKGSNGNIFLAHVQVMQTAHALLTSHEHMSKRELFYRHVELFGGKQAVLDAAVDTVALTVGVPRDALNIV